MTQLRTELAHTVLLLHGYRTTLETMLSPEHRELTLLLDYSAGLDLLHIIIQLLVVSEGTATQIFQECHDFAPTPQHYQLGFLDILENTSCTKANVMSFIRTQRSFTVIIDRLATIHRPRRLGNVTPWWLDIVADTMGMVWGRAASSETSASDQARLDLLLEISLWAGKALFSNDPPRKVRSAFSKLQDTLGQHSLEHRSMSTLGFRKDTIYHA